MRGGTLRQGRALADRPILSLPDGVSHEGAFMMLGLLYFIKLNLASDAELISNPPPLGKRLHIIERRFLRAGPRQAAFKLLIGQIVTLYHTPERRWLCVPSGSMTDVAPCC